MAYPQESKYIFAAANKEARRSAGRKNTAKKVIEGCLQKYDIEEITILEGHRVQFSGAFGNFYRDCNPDMVLYRNELLKREVEDKTVFNFRKLFVFLAEER